MANGIGTAGTAAAIGGAAIPGIGSLLVPALFSLLPGLIGLISGDPQKKLRRRAGRLIGSQGTLANQLYQQALGSPAFAQAQGAIGAGANQTANQVAASLAARGIGTSGTGAILSGLTPSLVGSQMAGLRTQTFSDAQRRAAEQIAQQLQLLMGTSGPSPAQTGFGQGINALAPFLQQYLGARYPQFRASTPTG